MTATLEELRADGVISPLDRHFARGVARVGGDDRPEVLLAAALASRQMAAGDVCVDLERLARTDEADWPVLDAWLEALSGSPLVSGADSANDGSPLVLAEGGRLYLRRFFEDERRVATDLSRRAEADVAPGDAANTRESIERLLPVGADTREIDWPRVAAAVAVARRLCVISGRPGTGKTTTAARLLAVLVEDALLRGEDAPRIELAAPTGKAAARLAEAIGQETERLECESRVRDAIPRSARTLHRLIGLGRMGPFRETARSIRADIVLVDEASMVDLALMAQLVAALPEHARLILLGDADQLASVEAGSVFADVCGPRRPPEYRGEIAAWISAATGQSPWVVQSDAVPISDCVVRLQKSYRYDEQSGIGELARAVQAGNAPAALEILDDPAREDVARLDHDADSPQALERAIARGYESFATTKDVAGRLAALDRFRVLCAVREGPFGVLRLARLADEVLAQAGWLAARRRQPAEAAEGRPILITRNAPHLDLYNGDVGVLAREPGAPGVRAFFSAGTGALRGLGVSRLPSHELVFAMSVHKSQGSEFDEVAFVLPSLAPGESLPLLTRELVYTAVTRARSRVIVHGSAEVLAAAIAQRVERASGLRDALWGGRG